MLKRSLLPILKNRAKKYPIVTLTGPRQSGKTTLSQMAFPDKSYVNLENPEVRRIAIEDPNRFLNQYPDGAILDEVQRTPELFSYLQTLVDADKRNGLFILTGSQNFNFIQSVNQSLAGRTSILELVPFSMEEISKQIKNKSIDEILIQGFYPKIYDQNIKPQVLLSDYVKTYIERDIRLIENIRNLNLFEKFIRLCAGRVGQVINKSNLANEVGVSSTTIEEWLSLLRASYIIFYLQPHFRSYNKRIIKSPKLYFYDVGLASYFLEIETPAQMSRDRMRGSLFENLIIGEVLKYRLNQGKDARFGFFRDNVGNEVDLILRHQGKMIPWEIKSAETYHQDFLKGINYFSKISKDPVNHASVIYGGNKEQKIAESDLISYKKLNQKLNKIFENDSDK
jgi:hypothetical protein